MIIVWSYLTHSSADIILWELSCYAVVADIIIIISIIFIISVIIIIILQLLLLLFVEQSGRHRLWSGHEI